MKLIIKVMLLGLIYWPIFSKINFSSNNYNNDMLAYVKSFLPSRPVVLEAGGHLGEDTLRMKNIWPWATMHVFEPFPVSYVKMISALEGSSLVFCYPYALTTFSGKTNFYINIQNNGASSIGRPVQWNKNEFEKIPIEIPCITINEWAKINNVTHVDFMWLDMEGHELYALQHASEILNTVKAIFTEISFVPIREDSCSYEDLRKFLESKGFCEVWKSSNTGRFGDALFVRL